MQVLAHDILDEGEALTVLGAEVGADQHRHGCPIRPAFGQGVSLLEGLECVEAPSSADGLVQDAAFDGKDGQVVQEAVGLDAGARGSMSVGMVRGFVLPARMRDSGRVVGRQVAAALVRRFCLLTLNLLA